jgi:N-acetylneuraminic acid mutarotase
MAMAYLNEQRSSVHTFLFAFLLTIGLVTICTVPVLAGTGAFNKTGSMNTARVGHSATLLANGKVLVAGGWNGSELSPTFFASAELYDPVRGKWSFTGSMTVARVGQSAVLLQDGEVLVAGGDGNTPSTAELYNPATGTWTATGSMTTARSTNLVLLPNGEVLAAGGDNKTPSTAELYNPVSGTWTATSSLSSGGFGGSTVLLRNGLVLALTNNSVQLAAELYDPSTGTWSSTAPPMSPGSYLALLPSGEAWNEGTLYDPTTGQWTWVGGAAPCKGCAVVMLANGNVLAAGGVKTVAGNPYPTTVAVKTAKLWDLAVGEQLGCVCLSWQSTGNLTTSSRTAESIVLLSNGQALVSGGYTSTNSGSFVVIATAELYTP